MTVSGNIRNDNDERDPADDIASTCTRNNYDNGVDVWVATHNEHSHSCSHIDTQTGKFSTGCVVNDDGHDTDHHHNNT